MSISTRAQKQIIGFSLLTKKILYLFHTCFTAYFYDTNEKNAKENQTKKFKNVYTFGAGRQCEYNTPVPSANVGENW